jgi:hypothetical protein
MIFEPLTTMLLTYGISGRIHSSYRKIFLSVIRDRCEKDSSNDTSWSRITESGASKGLNLQAMKPERAMSRRSRMMASRLSEEEEKETKQRQDLESIKSSRSARTRHSVHGSLSNSVHGVRRISRGTEPLSQSFHRVIASFESSGTLKFNQDLLSHSPSKSQSMRFYRPKTHGSKKGLTRDDSSVESASVNKQTSTAPYFEKLCWACEQLDYPFEYADIVGSQFLGFESATPITHVDGHVPTMDELVDFLSLAFLCISDYAQLTTVFIDDFQWVDAFSWRVFRTICKRANSLLLICATRSHDKQALRRITSAASPDNQFQSQMIEISLGPLDFNDIRDLISKILLHKKAAISDDLCTDIFQRTGGMPVYVIQLLENIKRLNTLHLVNGMLKWTEEGLKQNVSFFVVAFEFYSVV